MSPFRNVPQRDITSFIIKLLTAAIAYGILLGQVMQMDARLARVENVLLNHRVVDQQMQLIPPAEAGTKK